VLLTALPRRGYRFVGPVEAADAEGELPAAAPAEAAPALPLPDKPSIAVLPFENLSGDPGCGGGVARYHAGLAWRLR
jgi:DNA-binding winged helix-turn-helix (wHTH) protein